MVWHSDNPIDLPGAQGAAQWLRVTVRALGFLIGTAILIWPFLIGRLLVRVAPRLSDALTGPARQGWGRVGLWMCGLRLDRQGRQMPHGGAIVANHTSWIDIFAMHAAGRVTFVSKAEVRKWPLIGLIGRIAGTIFIERRASQSRAQTEILRDHIRAGHDLCFFPEGTSTDGQQVIPFKSTLFATFRDPALSAEVWVQPVTIRYRPAAGRDPRFYGWWGDMSFGAHMLTMLGRSRGGRVTVQFHPPVRSADYADRKLLARYCETVVRDGLDALKDGQMDAGEVIDGNALPSGSG
ncbi:lysophospholipid acyltransferase family protein [Oceanomicrobium pacificus]|uniref:1-acyl-sn-glycerol-3-phosphate acyltransferase n=1 Tax=Oceanomicrobium pacificus TaxID=2692916 RepID=A0A6B0TYR6_9RHOB|nr:lysophospholipid acyltransferase family protein [Oceanomicrobium pacificus]MXU66153.1 1-acyl-sn-glycerol-3-phosphate acyltransferase [Oceanomicrobium pacificus]